MRECNILFDCLDKPLFSLIAMKYITPACLIQPASSLARWFAPVVAALAVSACASIATSSSPEEQVRQRAQARWDAQIAGDWKTAYSLTTPSYRALRNLDFYRASVGGAASWKAVEVVRVSCNEDGQACSARIKLDYDAVVRPGQALPSSTYFNENWVLEEGQWYFHARR